MDVPVDTLGAGAQQIIEIMRAFYNNPSVLILDEPTASLGEGEIRPFLDFVIDLRDQMGISVIFISHKIEEVFAIADYITVFTEGNSVLTSRTGAKFILIPSDDSRAHFSLASFIIALSPPLLYRYI